MDWILTFVRGNSIYILLFANLRKKSVNTIIFNN